MEALRRLVGASWRTQPVFPDDDIYPVQFLDQVKVLRDFILAWSMIFNDVLDADRLHSSLARLLELEDWRKLGGRLRRNAIQEDGRLEIHVPRIFTAERPPVVFTHQTFDVSINEHPIAKSMPRATQVPSVQKGADYFRQFGVREDAPTTFEDFLYQDIPQLSLHVTSFTDATIVALSFPHTLMDAMGYRALLQAWSLVLAGREDEVPPVLEARGEITAQVVEEPTGEEAEEFHLEPRRIRGFGLFRFMMRFIWDILWNRDAQDRTICLPPSAVLGLRRGAQEELAAAGGNGDERPFISDGDVLVAWATRAASEAEPRARPYTILSSINMRFWIPSLKQPTGVYIQNMAMAVYVSLSSTAARGPVGQIALAHRQHLAEQTRAPQLRAFLRKGLEMPDALNIFGDPDAKLISCTNWAKARFLTAADFSPAVLGQGESQATRRNPLGSIVLHYAQSLRPSVLTRNSIQIIGKDHGGNYWLKAEFRPHVWAKIEEQLAAMR